MRSQNGWSASDVCLHPSEVGAGVLRKVQKHQPKAINILYASIFKETYLPERARQGRNVRTRLPASLPEPARIPSGRKYLKPLLKQIIGELLPHLAEAAQPCCRQRQAAVTLHNSHLV